MSKNLSWIKSMHNGSLGEARAKAFLLNRFWVLERSIDIDGADYLIQRKLTRQNYSIYDSSCFGIVQVKFFNSRNTPIYIPADYVLDDNNDPRLDFYLLVFTGDEDNSEIYYLSSEDISKFVLNETTKKFEIKYDGEMEMRYSGTYIKVSKFKESVQLFEEILNEKAVIYTKDRWAEFKGFSIYSQQYDLENNIKLSNLDLNIKIGNNIILEFITDDIEIDYIKLRDIGIKTLSEICFLDIKTPYKFFHFCDNDGNQFEVGQYL
jgi:hypothetical protein